MRWVHLSIAGLLIVVAVLQLDDPDPVYWVLVYGLSGVAACAMAFGRSSRLVLGILIGAASVRMLESLGGVFAYFGSADPGSIFGQMMPEKPWVEPAREFLGLAMLVGVLVWYVGLHRKAASGTAGGPVEDR